MSGNTAPTHPLPWLCIIVPNLAVTPVLRKGVYTGLAQQMHVQHTAGIATPFQLQNHIHVAQVALHISQHFLSYAAIAQNTSHTIPQ